MTIVWNNPLCYNSWVKQWAVYNSVIHAEGLEITIIIVNNNLCVTGWVQIQTSLTLIHLFFVVFSPIHTVKNSKQSPHTRSFSHTTVFLSHTHTHNVPLSPYISLYLPPVLPTCILFANFALGSDYDVQTLPLCVVELAKCQRSPSIPPSVDSPSISVPLISQVQ